MTLLLSRCSCCGALWNQSRIEQHNIRCAKTGERSYTSKPALTPSRRKPTLQIVAPRFFGRRVA